VDLLNKIITVIIDPALEVLLGVSVLYFVWGVWKFVSNAESPEARQDGGRHILFATIGIFVMVSVFGIMSIIVNSFNLR
jgi:hypothetical protein